MEYTATAHMNTVYVLSDWIISLSLLLLTFKNKRNSRDIGARHRSFVHIVKWLHLC